LKQKALLQWNSFASQRFLFATLEAELLCTALNHMGRLQENEKIYDLAEQALRESLKINPQQPGVVQHWIHIRQKACIWPVYEELPGLSLSRLRQYTSPLGMLALTEDPAVQLLTCQNFVQRTFPPSSERLSRKDKVAMGRKRVGLVSADLREHAVGFLLPEFLKGHDSEAYELYAYDFTPEEDTPLRRDLKRMFHHFIDISMLTDRQAAERIAQDGIDILIDMHGLSAGARAGIFALRPAPLQGTYLGFIGPSGMPWLDFVIADPHVLPPELAIYFTEKPVYVDGSFIPLDRKQVPIPTVTRQELNLPEEGFLMAAFGNVYKITPEMFQVWMNILKRIERSYLCLIDDNPTTVRHLKQQVEMAGVDPGRVRFLPRSDHPTFCARLRVFDVFLDTYPYNCGSTTSDVVNAGLPMVTRYGRTMVSRMGLSILTQSGDADHAVGDFEAYERKVVEIALRRQVRHDRRAFGRVSPMLNQALARACATAPASMNLTKTNGSAMGPVGVQLVLHPLQSGANGDRAGSLVEPFLDSATHLRQIRDYLLNRSMDEHSLYGFYVPEMLKCTGLSERDLENFALQAGADIDMLVFSPYWDLASLSLNPFLLAEARSPGIARAAQRLADTAGLKVQVANWVSCADASMLGLFFIARRKVWMDWLELADRLLMQEDDAIRPHLPLLYVLLGNFLLMQNRYKFKAFDTFSLCAYMPSEEPRKGHALICDALKASYQKTNHRRYLDEFLKWVSQCTETRDGA
jgi:predicted O-linked N-acetylglucosamine transferase (SPINDLY family)